MDTLPEEFVLDIFLVIDEAQVLCSEVLSNEFMHKTENAIIADGDEARVKRDSEEFSDVCLCKIADVYLVIGEPDVQKVLQLRSSGKFGIFHQLHGVALPIPASRARHSTQKILDILGIRMVTKNQRIWLMGQRALIN